MAAHERRLLNPPSPDLLRGYQYEAERSGGSEWSECESVSVEVEGAPETVVPEMTQEGAPPPSPPLSPPDGGTSSTGAGAWYPVPLWLCDPVEDADIALAEQHAAECDAERARNASLADEEAMPPDACAEDMWAHMSYVEGGYFDARHMLLCNKLAHVRDHGAVTFEYVEMYDDMAVVANTHTCGAFRILDVSQARRSIGIQTADPTLGEDGLPFTGRLPFEHLDQNGRTSARLMLDKHRAPHEPQIAYQRRIWYRRWNVRDATITPSLTRAPPPTPPWIDVRHMLRGDWPFEITDDGDACLGRMREYLRHVAFCTCHGNLHATHPCTTTLHDDYLTMSAEMYEGIDLVHGLYGRMCKQIEVWKRACRAARRADTFDADATRYYLHRDLARQTVQLAQEAWLMTMVPQPVTATDVLPDDDARPAMPYPLIMPLCYGFMPMLPKTRDGRDCNSAARD